MSDFVKGEIEKIFFTENPEISVPLSKKRYIIVTDEEHGNVTACFPIKTKNLGSGWIAMYQDALSKVADEGLTYEEYRVFLKLLSKTDFENYLVISQKIIADELKMKQPNVSRAIKGLCNRNIIAEGPRLGMNKTYRLNPYVGHKGRNRKDTVVKFSALKNNKKNPHSEE